MDNPGGFLVAEAEPLTYYSKKKKKSFGRGNYETYLCKTIETKSVYMQPIKVTAA